LKETIRRLILGLGADVCGFSDISRFAGAPEGFHPTDIFKSCRSVIVLGTALPKSLYDVAPRFVYGHFNSASIAETDRIAFAAAKRIEEQFGAHAVPVPCDGPYEYWDEANMEGRGLISMKHAAVCAGIGTIGKSTLLLNAEFGSRLTIGAVLTDIEIESDAPAKNICIENCRLCIESCPSGALDGVSANQKKCRKNTYGRTPRGFETVDCNICRTVCPMKYGVR